MTASYIHGQGIDEPIKGLSPTGTVPEWYYTFDGLGSVVDLTDSTGAVVEQYKYDSFGKLQATPTTGNPYTYTGREYDIESGLYFYRARYYDANIGRFLTDDPSLKKSVIIPYFLPLLLLDPQQLNAYVYVSDNPVSLIDPSGHKSTKSCPGKRFGVFLKCLAESQVAPGPPGTGIPETILSCSVCIGSIASGAGIIVAIVPCGICAANLALDISSVIDCAKQAANTLCEPPPC